MRKIFGFLGQTRAGPPGSKTSGSTSVGTIPETGDRATQKPSYFSRKKHLRKLHNAVCKGKVPEVQQLLSLHPDSLNDTDRRKRTALHLACAHGHLGVVTLLAERKCQLNLCDYRKRTALMKAIQYQEEGCAFFLLECGADPNIMDKDGDTALHYAVAEGNIAMAEKLLLKEANIEAKNKDGLTPFLLAVQEHQQEMVEFLIKRNANIHAVDKIKRTALMLAAKDKSSHTVRLLLQLDVDVFSQDVFGRTAYEYACYVGSAKNIRLIATHKPKGKCIESSQNSNPVDKCPEKDASSRNDNMISEYKEEKTCKESSETSNLVKGSKENQQREREYGTVSLGNEVQDSKIDQSGELPVEGSEEKQQRQKQRWAEPGENQARDPESPPLPGELPVKGSKENQQGEKEYWTESGETLVQPFKVQSEDECSENDSSSSTPKVFIISDHKQERRCTESSESSNLDIDLHSSAKKEWRETNSVTVKGSKENQQREKEYGTDSVRNWAQDSRIHRPGDLPGPKENQKREKEYGKETGRIQAQESMIQRPEELPVDDSPEKDTLSSLSRKPDVDDSWSTSDDEDFDFATKKEAKKPAFVKLENVKMSALGLGEEEQVESSPWDSESYSSSHSQKNVDHFSGAADQREKNTINGQEEGSPEKYPHLEPIVEVKDPDSDRAVEEKDVQVSISGRHYGTTLEEQQERLDGSESNNPRVVPEQSDTPKPLSLEQNDGWLQGAVWTHDLCKPKETKIDLKINSETFLVCPLDERDLSQTEHPKEDIGLMNQTDTFMGKLESFEKRICHVEEEIELLRQQLDAVHNESIKLVEVQLQNFVGMIKDESAEQIHIQQVENTELMDEIHRIKAEIKVVRTQLQQQLVDTLKRQVSQASLQVTPPYHVNLEAETQDIKKTLRQITRQVDDLPDKLQTASSEHTHVDKKIESLQKELLSMRGTCEMLKNKQKMLEEELPNFKRYMTRNIRVEQYTQETDERARQDLVEKFKEIHLLLQAQATSQKYLEQLIENQTASIKWQMELKIKDLESDLCRVTTSQESAQIELQKYKQLYQEEVKMRTSLENQLNKASESLAETRTQLEEERRSAVLRAAPARPVPEPPRAGCLSGGSLRGTHLAPRERQFRGTSFQSMVTYLTEVQRKIANNIIKELNEVEEDSAEDKAIFD